MLKQELQQVTKIYNSEIKKELFQGKGNKKEKVNFLFPYEYKFIFLDPYYFINTIVPQQFFLGNLFFLLPLGYTESDAIFKEKIAKNLLEIKTNLNLNKNKFTLKPNYTLLKSGYSLKEIHYILTNIQKKYMKNLIINYGFK